MNILSSLINRDQQKAVEFVNNFSKVYRKLLELREQPLVNLKQELEFTEAYLFLQRMRFDSSLKVEMNLGEGETELELPPFTLQLLVENAIKHNIVSMSKPLTIKIEKEQNFISVSNNLQTKRNEARVYADRIK